MKDKLEVGHFIRTIKGIGRIEEITEDKTEIYFNCDTGLTISFIKKDFTQEEMAQYYKHSDSIIDLVEKGDYVNGYKVLDILKGFKILVDKLELNTYDGNYYLKQFTNDEIKSIVTKEVFKANEYRMETD